MNWFCGKQTMFELSKYLGKRSQSCHNEVMW